ncbi:MAG: hypothetical protein K9G65_05990 [Rickettsiaceae bacterium]|nr:hypothetical protein [Rickettsiaceae bacterium]
MRLLHLEYKQYPVEARNILDEMGEVVPLEVVLQSDLIQFLKKDNHFDTIFTRLGLMISEEVIDLLPNLKYIVTSTTGLNHIEVKYAEKKGIKVISLKGEFEFLANIKSTAEHTWLLLLSLLRHHVSSVKDVIDNKNWNREPFLSDEVDGKTIGIIGYGRLGKIIAKYAKAFSANVLVNDVTESSIKNDIQFSSLEFLLKNSDIVFLMINYSDENLAFFNEEKFLMMKKGAYFINTSRGELVVENALLSALVSGHLKGAALDVLNGDSSWERKFEGIKELFEYASQNSNLIITPHMGGFGSSSISKTRNFIVEKFKSLIDLAKS